MIRYLSCTHNNAVDNLTTEELALFKVGKGVIVTEGNKTRFEECVLKLGTTTFRCYPLTDKHEFEKGQYEKIM